MKDYLIKSLSAVALWQGWRVTIAFSKFWTGERASSSKTFVRKCKFEAETHVLRTFGSKVEVLSTHDPLCWKFSAM